MPTELSQPSIGQIVHLKSGSPELEVVATATNSAAVRWQDGAGNQLAVFPFECLEVGSSGAGIIPHP